MWDSEFLPCIAAAIDVPALAKLGVTSKRPSSEAIAFSSIIYGAIQDLPGRFLTSDLPGTAKISWRAGSHHKSAQMSK